MTEVRSQTRGALFGLAAAALFGVSAPIAKVLLGEVAPVLLAGLLYLGAATGLWLHRAFTAPSDEAALGKGDVPKLALVVLAGGLVGPVLMMLGLARVTALAGSLLLNLEAPFTVLVAVAVFREHLGRHAIAAVVCIVGGAVVLRLEPGALRADTLGVVLLAGACLAWAVDNNLTQRLSLRDPFAIVRVKTLVAGVINTALGLVITAGTMPPAKYALGALVLGSLSYGVSVVLDAYALRYIGAAREAAFFASAPFVGVLVSVSVLGEPFGRYDMAAMAAMIVGVVLLLRERHSHMHAHEAVEHEHLHTHDAHHQHLHVAGDPEGEPHSHPHRHEPMVHEHPHVSDAHHRHRH